MRSRRFFWSALTVLTVVFLVSGMALVAFADGFQADADALVASAPHANFLTANQQAGTTVAYDLSAQVVNTGNATNDVFRSGHPEDNVVASIARSGDWLDASPGAPASFTFTAYDTPAAGTIRVTVPCDAANLSSKSMTAVLTPTASNTQSLTPASITLTYTITATTPADSSCTTPNSPPTVDASGPYTGNEGANVNIAGTASDPDNDPLTYKWTYALNSADPSTTCSFGDDTALSTTVNCSDNGTFTLTLTATGDPAGPVGDTASLSLDNVAPTGTFNTPAGDVNEGGSFNLSITGVTDPSSVDSAAGFTYAFDCGSGYGSFGSSSSASCSTAVDGPGSLSVGGKVKDKDGDSTEYTGSVTVDNVNPTVGTPTWLGGNSVDCGVSKTLTNITFSDPGLVDYPWAVDISWGGSETADPTYNTNTQGGQSDASHTYNTPGTYQATVGVTDKDGGFGSANSATLTVNQTYTVDFLPPFDDSSPSGLIVNKMKNGRVVPVKATLYDDCAGAYVTDPNTIVTILTSKTSGTGTGDPIETYADAGQSSAGTNMFRWTADSSAPGGGFWIYNLDSKALGLVVNNLYRVDIYVGSVKATTDTWGVLQPVK